jgi:hypothetical protein
MEKKTCCSSIIKESLINSGFSMADPRKRTIKKGLQPLIAVSPLFAW